MSSLRGRYRHTTLTALAVGILFVAWHGASTAFSAEGKIEPLANDEGSKWLRWVIPLPKQVRFEGKLRMPATDIAVQLRENSTDVERHAVYELTGLLSRKTGVQNFKDGSFSITIGVCDAEGKIDGTLIPGAETLRELKNSDQAYLITPLSGSGLAVTALSERGVYYGVKTLQQLLESRLAVGSVTMPIVTIVDWPDLAERGEWEFLIDLDGEIEFFADRKLNLIEAWCAHLSLDDQGHGVATFDTGLANVARLRAIKWIPIISHFEHLPTEEVYKRFPETKGQGSHARTGPDGPATLLCFSEAKTKELLADWFTSLSSIEGIDEICVWLSEQHIWCECDQCKTSNQHVLEAEACVQAWRLARKKNPHLRLRILLTQGSYPANKEVLAAISDPEVRVLYYHGGLTYNSKRDPIVYPLLEQFVKKDRWLGIYPQISASWSLVCPWSGPQFVKFRMNEFVDKGLQCVSVRASADDRFSDFNLTATAEWSWNAKGRSEHEFAEAWAVRHGLSDPEKAADLIEMLGSVSWDVYGSGIPTQSFPNSSVKMIENRAQPELGSGIFLYFPTVEHIDHDLTVCNKALKLAEELGDVALLSETRVVQGYVRMLKSIHVIAHAVAGKQPLGDADRRTLQTTFDELDHARRDVLAALDAWRHVTLPGGPPGRYKTVLKTTDETVSGIAAALASFGVKQSGSRSGVEK